ncbi:MAG TPA: diguanylate cyclase [Solirubrobacteraceae bacterium]|nr:diguanylate cyclase [Solirubrobacteraceae bacterium]
MSRLNVIRLSIVSKAAIAVVAFALALWAVAAVAALATQAATRGATRVEAEFAERVQMDAAMGVATDNYRLALARMRAPSAADARRIDQELDASDARLAQAIGTALHETVFNDREVGLARDIRIALPAYVATRERIFNSAGPSDTQVKRDRLRTALDRLLAAQEAFGANHYAEAAAHLRELRAGSRWRGIALVVALGFGLAALIAVLLLVRRVGTRVREYADFAGSVAEGNLTTHLEPRSRDELGELALSLNAMVHELADAARQRQQAREDDRAYRAGQDAFADAMQVTESEQEAHGLLRLHIERWVPDSHVVVLSRRGDDELEASAPVAEDSALYEPLDDADTRSCLAIRLARVHESGVEPPPLLECGLCGKTSGQSTCLPLMVSGEVIGSVLVEHEGPLEHDHLRRINDSVGQATPTLANLRNLALAEARAATDALTGLPNRRAVQDTLKRMIAQAGRTLAPMAALVLDLDQFKAINDTYGHDRGDAVLCAVSDVLRRTLRTSDFVGRNGGEEFIALLPDTDAEGAMEAAEKLRAAVAQLTLPGIDRPVTTSVGAAIFPHAAADAQSLLRLADRALYAAKAGGRDRAELAETPAVAPAAT